MYVLLHLFGRPFSGHYFARRRGCKLRVQANTCMFKSEGTAECRCAHSSKCSGGGGGGEKQVQLERKLVPVSLFALRAGIWRSIGLVDSVATFLHSKSHCLRSRLRQKTR